MIIYIYQIKIYILKNYRWIQKYKQKYNNNILNKQKKKMKIY